FTFDVLTHAVQLRAPISQQRRVPAVESLRTGLRKEAIHRDDSRIDEERAGGRKPDVNTLESERIAELGVHVVVRVAAPSQRRQDVVDSERTAETTEHVPLLAETVDSLDDFDRRERPPAERLELQTNRRRLPLPQDPLAPITKKTNPDYHSDTHSYPRARSHNSTHCTLIHSTIT